MFHLDSGRTTDPAIVAVFAQHGMVHASKQIPLPGKWSLLGGIELNAFASPDALWLAIELPSAGLESYLPWSLTHTIPGLNLPSVSVRRKDAPGPGQAQGQPKLAMQGDPLEFASVDFNSRFEVRSVDPRAGMMLIDEGMMQWLIECDRVSFEMHGDELSAIYGLVGADGNPPSLLERLFQFCEGFAARIPDSVRSEFAAGR